VEDDLKQQVAEFVSKPLWVVRIDSVEDLVRLFEKMFGQRAMRLFGVPRTAAGCPETSHHLEETEDAVSAFARRNRLL
jgi:hypothetical protein